MVDIRCPECGSPCGVHMMTYPDHIRNQGYCVSLELTCVMCKHTFRFDGVVIEPKK